MKDSRKQVMVNLNLSVAILFLNMEINNFKVKENSNFSFHMTFSQHIEYTDQLECYTYDNHENWLHKRNFISKFGFFFLDKYKKQLIREVKVVHISFICAKFFI